MRLFHSQWEVGIEKEKVIILEKREGKSESSVSDLDLLYFHVKYWNLIGLVIRSITLGVSNTRGTTRRIVTCA